VTFMFRICNAFWISVEMLFLFPFCVVRFSLFVSSEIEIRSLLSL
jgi:hypothetical protein